MENDALVVAAARFADKVGAALRELAADLRSSGTVSDVLLNEPTGARQQQILEVEGLGIREGMKVADIARAIGGYDAANTHLTLRSLEKKGAVELVSGSAPQHWRLTKSYLARRRVWDREELILALRCYLDADGQPSQADIDQLKSDLVYWGLAHGQRGRSSGSISYKLGNFRAIATDGREGFPHWGSLDEQIHNEFADEPEKVAAEAEAILQRLDDMEANDAAQR